MDERVLEEIILKNLLSKHVAQRSDRIEHVRHKAGHFVRDFSTTPIPLYAMMENFYYRNETVTGYMNKQPGSRARDHDLSRNLPCLKAHATGSIPPPPPPIPRIGMDAHSISHGRRLYSFGAARSWIPTIRMLEQLLLHRHRRRLRDLETCPHQTACDPFPVLKLWNCRENLLPKMETFQYEETKGVHS